MPGRLEFGGVDFFFRITGIVLVIAWAFVLDVWVRDPPRGARTAWLSGCAILVSGGAIALTRVDAARRAAFELYRGELDACVAGSDMEHLRVGPWEGRLAHDPGGGAFFVTYEVEMGSDGVRVAGFAFRSNDETTLFTSLRREPLGGDWDEFEAWVR